MGLQAGIVGLPNVGKSTLFNALTAAGAAAANYPFATIEPNIGVVEVPDPRLQRIAAHIDTVRIIPATVEVLDIAGLVKGASTGEGLGNQFLAHIRSVDAILSVVRCFESADVTHVEGDVNPIRDIEIVDLELILADLAVMERRQERLERALKTGDKQAAGPLETTKKVVAALSAGTPVREMRLTVEDAAALAEAQLLTAKPVLYVCNVDESGLHGNTHTEAVSEKYRDAVIICAELEAEIAELDSGDREAFLDEVGLEEPGLSRLARETYRLLGLETFFTAGPKEIRAWTVAKGTRAPAAAGEIHTDFERGFIRAEVYRIEDLESYGSEAALRAAGKIRSEGREYVVQDGDVILFRFNV